MINSLKTEVTWLRLMFGGWLDVRSGGGGGGGGGVRDGK